MDTVAAIALPALRSLIGTPRAPLVIDVRKPPAFDADPVMIASALRRPHDAVDDWAAALPRGRDIVVYCVHGHEVSQGAARALAARGASARYLEGGIEAWKAAGAPVMKKLVEIGHGAAAPTPWVTRERPKIDRVASPWPVPRLLDPLAAFDYVPPERVLDAAKSTGAGGVYQIPVEAISRNPRQPRAEISSESLEELTSSIRENGILQPLILAPGEQSGTYTLIAGERRLQAARQVGLQKVPALVRSASEQQYLELALVENLIRTDLSPLDTAEAYRQLVDDFGLSHEKIVHNVGKSRVSITNTLRLLKAARRG